MLAQTYIYISDLVMKSTKTLDERLVDILQQNGGRETLDTNLVDIYEIHNANGFSGFNYWVEGVLIGQLQIATLTSGNYVIYKRVYLENQITEIYDYYDSFGNYTYCSAQLDCPAVMFDSINMDPSSPFLNHIYNILYNEYEKARTGKSLSQRIIFLESLLRNYAKDETIHLSCNDGSNDIAITNIEREIYRIENDPVLKWQERQDIFASLKEIRSKIIETKKRVHNLSMLNYSLPIHLHDAIIKYNRIKARPVSNIKGLAYKWTLGKLFWFLGTVKDNLGYSIALAIYGPFTFYFITQPMNPHAMWAVGKVRNAYLTTIGSLESKPSETSEAVVNNDEATETSVNQDQVNTKMSAVNKTVQLNTDANVSWEDRMSNFKAMQIAYEGNMVFAARMGRIEQFESQLSFPLTAESAWHESVRYINSAKAALQYNTNLDIRYKNFLTNEVQRAEELQVYIWKKMAQFFLDYPFIEVDQANEQDQRDYYIGRAFIFMTEMTEVLAKKNLTSMPATHAKVQSLSDFYRTAKVQGSSILDTLKKNSKLFSQNDLFNTKEYRSYMKNHWEVLFLQQNKKQEASSFGLQTYTWSVKNALWTMQSIYSAKREEINTMTYKFNLNNMNTAAIKPNKEIDAVMESMMYMLTAEYVSIKEEFSKNLKYDEEALLREKIINNMKNYLTERDKLYHSPLQMANSASDSSVQL